MKLFAGTLLAAGLWAQSNATDAALNGYVRDESGASIPAAKVTARNLATNTEVAGTTNQDGYFRFPLLRVGEYALRASAPGFAEFEQTGVRLTVGQQGRIDVTLKVGTAADSVIANSRNRRPISPPMNRIGMNTAISDRVITKPASSWLASGAIGMENRRKP